jgi:hypothetical protein
MLESYMSQVYVGKADPAGRDQEEGKEINRPARNGGT